jgi:hypothetical protein
MMSVLPISITASWASEPDPIDELKKCAHIENSDERFACYELLGKRVLAVEAEEAVPESITAVVAEPEEEDDEYRPIHAHVRTCQPARDNRWFFIMNSGEVWKQSGGKIRRFKDCDFDVTIRKDVFGYTMEIAGDDNTVRVRRHK